MGGRSATVDRCISALFPDSSLVDDGTRYSRDITIGRGRFGLRDTRRPKWGATRLSRGSYNL